MSFYSALPELSPPESNRSAASSDMPLDCGESSLQIALFAVSGWTRGLCITCRGRCEILENGAEALNSRVFEHESNVNPKTNDWRSLATIRAARMESPLSSKKLS